MIIDRDDVDSVTKMVYLKSALKGHAHGIVSHLSVSSSFESAWESVCDEYEVPQILMPLDFDKILNTEPIPSRSSMQLSLMMANVEGGKIGLKGFNQPVDQWDAIMIHTAAQRLDSKTREAWEVVACKSKDTPTYAEFTEFVNRQASILRMMEADYGCQSPSESLADHTDYPCPMCDDDHYIANCPEFRRLTPRARKEITTANRLCYNCFGKHHVQRCDADERCGTCNRKHHTMIHIDGVDPAGPPRHGQRKGNYMSM